MDHQQADMFSYLSPEARVRKDHPLRAVRSMTDEILSNMSPLFDAMYAEVGRPSIPPEKLLRAQLLQMFFSVRSERILMEEIDYSILYRWFVGLNLDERFGMQRRLRRTATDCWKRWWLRSFWLRWWSVHERRG
jgi:transposase